MSNTDTDGGGQKRYNIRLHHDGCWMIDTTVAHPGTHIIEKSFYHGDEEIKTDIIAYVDDDHQSRTDIDDVIETIEDHSDVRSVTTLGRLGQRARLMVHYSDDHSVNTNVANSDIMPIEPVHATNGLEHWSVLTEPGTVGEVLQDLEEACDAEIESIRGFDSNSDVVFTDIVDQINDQLSPRQTHSLLTADSAGYYNWPRDVSAKEVAEQMDVSGPTCLEHLRKGEQKIVQTVIEELQSRHGRTSN